MAIGVPSPAPNKNMPKLKSANRNMPLKSKLKNLVSAIEFSGNIALVDSLNEQILKTQKEILEIQIKTFQFDELRKREQVVPRRSQSEKRIKNTPLFKKQRRNSETSKYQIKPTTKDFTEIQTDLNEEVFDNLYETYSNLITTLR